LAVHHPDLFMTAYRQARAAQATKKVALGWLQGFSDDVTVGDTGSIATTFTDTPDTTVDFSQLNTTPELQTISFDQSALSTLPSNLISDSVLSGASGVLDTIANNTTSAGSSLGSALGGGSGILSALGSVGGWLTSPTGLGTMASVAKSYFGAQAATSTQQAVVNAQIARAATGQSSAPITYTTNAAGQLVPVYATQTPSGTVYQPLTSQGISRLTPSGLSVFFSQYGIWLLLAGAVVWIARR
jgi:hypothetical protein